MAAQVASLFGVLSLDDKDFQKGMKNADSGFKSAKDKMKDFGDGVRNTGLVIMGAATPFLAFAASAVQSAGDSQRAVAQLEAAIKSTGGAAGVTSEHAQGLAGALQQVTMFSDETTLSAENMLLTFTNIGAGGGVFDLATQTALDMATALGGDVTNSAMQLGKALNDPINGITALTRVGVTFSDSQKAAIEAMVKTGDTAGAQKLILAELQKEFGGSATAAGQTFPGQLAILNNKFDEVKEKIGAALIPALMDIVKNIGPIIDKIALWIEKNPELVKDILLATGVVFGLGVAMTLLGTAIGIVSGAFALLFSPAILIIAAIGGLLWLINEKYPGGLKKCLEDAAHSAQMLAVLGLGALMVAADWARQKLQALLEIIDRIASGWNGISGIVNLVSSGQVSVGDVFNAAMNGAGGPIQPVTSGSSMNSNAVNANSGFGLPNNGQGISGGTHINGPININASTYEGGQAAGRGFLDAVRAKGG